MITVEKKIQYSIPTDMNKYVNENFKRFLLEKDLNEKIFKKNPVPRNNDLVEIYNTR